MKYKTSWITKNDIDRKWHIVDVSDQILGRASTKIASLLMGKDKVDQVPNIDNGDYVIVINSAKVKLTAGKEFKKFYFRHSGYLGNHTTTRFDKQIEKDATYVIKESVKNMLPKNKLRDLRMARLYVYEGNEHDQTAQKPVEYKL